MEVLVKSKPLDDADDDVHSYSSERVSHLHKRLSESTLKVLDVRRHSDIWQAIVSLEPSFLTFHPDGLKLTPRLYLGVNRRGTEYVNSWILENHVEVSMMQMLILRCLAFYKRFTTYDELFAFFQFENQGDLKMDLTDYPQKSAEEEKTEKMVLQDEKNRPLFEKEREKQKSDLKKKIDYLRDLIKVNVEKIDDPDRSQFSRDAIEKQMPELESRLDRCVSELRDMMLEDREDYDKIEKMRESALTQLATGNADRCQELLKRMQYLRKQILKPNYLYNSTAMRADLERRFNEARRAFLEAGGEMRLIPS